MLECVAARKLLYRIRGSADLTALEVRIYAPYELQEGMVDFSFSSGTAGCMYEIVGLPQQFSDTCFGADPIQALQLAADVDANLRMFNKKYEFFFPDGEPYFED
jgi:hypothetical protein